MRTVLAAAASLGFLLGASASADAGLLMSLVAGPGDAPQITLVRQGCGFGGHRGFLGGCRANFGPRGHVFARRHYYGGYGYGRPFHRGYFYRHY